MPSQMGEEDFRKLIHAKYPQYFTHVENLVGFAEESMGKFKGASVTAYHTVLWLILARAFKSLDSTRRLCELALCEDAGVILRSLLNLLAITRWISQEPENRARKYLGWYWIQMHKDAGMHPEQVPAAWVAEIKRHYEDSKKLFEYNDKKGKARIAKKWHQPEADNIEDLFKQVNLELEYDEAYRILSGLEHSDATAYFSMIIGMEKGADTRSLDVHNDLFVPHYLRNTFQYFADIFDICNQALCLADGEQFRLLRDEAIGFFKADMKK